MSRMSTPETLGERVHRFRRAANLTTKGLADAAGCNQSTVIELESDGNPTVRTVWLVADALGKTPADLFDGIRRAESEREDVTA